MSWGCHVQAVREFILADPQFRGGQVIAANSFFASAVSIEGPVPDDDRNRSRIVLYDTGAFGHTLAWVPAGWVVDGLTLAASDADSALRGRPNGQGPDLDQLPPIDLGVDHRWGPGLDDGSKETMARIADWVYYVVSHDSYHRAEAWYQMKSRADDEIKKMFGLVLGTSEAEVAEDLGALLDWIPSDPPARDGAMGCIGYCIGARSVLCTIRNRGDVFRAGVGLHPSFCTTEDPDSPNLAVSSYTGSLYIGFGSADKMQPASANGPLIHATNALANGEAEIHDGADHGFGVFGPAYHEAAATRSYERAKVMFDRELKG